MIDINELKSKFQIIALNSEIHFLKDEKEVLISEAEAAISKLYSRDLSHIIIQETIKIVNDKLYDALTIHEYLTAKEKQAKDLLSQKEGQCI